MGGRVVDACGNLFVNVCVGGGWRVFMSFVVVVSEWEGKKLGGNA